MKQVYLSTLLSLILLSHTDAQVACSYSFSYRTDIPFAELPNNSGTIILANGAADPTNPNAVSPTDEDIFPDQPIGFSFEFNGHTYQNCGVSTNGWIWFGDTDPVLAAGVVLPFTDVLASDSDIEGIISALNADLEGRWTAGEAAIRTKRDGIAPNRTFTIEWNNFKSLDDAEGTGYCGENRNRFDFQIILSEQNQSVSFAYRAAEYCWQGYSQFFQIGLRGAQRSDVHARSVIAGSNQWDSSVQGLNNSNVAIRSSSPSALPAQNARFVFTPGTPQPATWLGISNNWNDPSNWSPAQVPTRCTDVTIAGGLSHYPELSGTMPASCANLLIQEGASLTLTEGYNSFLSCFGNLINNGVLVNNTATYVTLTGTTEHQLGGTGHFLGADLFFTGASTYQLQNDLVIRNLSINQGASLYLNSFVLDVFSIIQQGTLNQGEGVLVIEGDASAVQLNDSTFEEAQGTTFFGNGEIWSNPLNQLVPSISYNNLWVRTHKNREVQLGTDQDFSCRNLMFYNPGEAGGLAITNRVIQVNGNLRLGIDSLPGTRLQLNHPINRINGNGDFSMGISDALHIKAASQNQQAALTGFNHPYFSGSVQYESESAQTIVPGTYNNLKISGAGTRTIHGRVNLKGVLQLEAGLLETGDSLTLKSDSLTTGLISGSGNGSLSGQIESERFIHGDGDQSVFLSNPFEGLHVIDYATAIPVPGPDGVTWSAEISNAIWEYNPNDPVEQFMNGFHSMGANRELLVAKGYSATLLGGSVLSTKGNATSGNVSIVLGSNGNNSQFSGYNLVGNPYLSPLDWNKAAFSQTDNISKAVYRMGSGNRYNGSFSVWMAISEDEGLGINGASSNIGIQEGFFVKAFTADTLRLNNSHRSDETNVHAVQVNDFRAYLRLSLIKDQKRDETLIWYDSDNNSQQLLDGQDALKPVMPGAMTITSVKDDRMLAIQGRVTAQDEDSVALALHVPANGSYTIRLTDVIHFPATAMMYLEDRLTGTFQNLRTEPSYTINLNEGDIIGRFFLHYRAGVETNAISEGCEGNDGQITLHNSASTQWDVKLFNSNDSLVAERNQFTGNWAIQALRADEYRLEFSLSGQSLLIDEYLVVETGNAISASLTASVTEVKMEEEEVVLTNTSIGSESVFWEFGDGMMLADEDEVSHIYSDPGQYDVVMRVTRGECSDTAMITIQVITITGIEDAKAPESFTLFPNPASTIAYIRPEIEEPLENGTYVIVDASGRVIFQKQVSYLSPGQTLELPVSDLPPGTYQVVLSTGKFKGVSRLMVNR